MIQVAPFFICVVTSQNGLVSIYVDYDYIPACHIDIGIFVCGTLEPAALAHNGIDKRLNRFGPKRP